MQKTRRFVALYDLHWGYERRNGHKIPLHDSKALSVALQFIEHFHPDVVILGGDMLDCGAISHHAKGKPGQTEGLRLLADAEGLQKALIVPLRKVKTKVYITGNHEDWLRQHVEETPGVEGLLDLDKLVDLDASWTLLPQGAFYKLGKLTFAHGDQFNGGEHVAKSAVVACERSIRFGHFHSYQAYTKTTVVDDTLGRNGVMVPCLCRKDPGYGKNAPNRWQQGFNFGWVRPDGTFNDYTALITNGRAIIHGVDYSG